MVQMSPLPFMAVSDLGPSRPGSKWDENCSTRGEGYVTPDGRGIGGSSVGGGRVDRGGIRRAT